MEAMTPLQGHVTFSLPSPPEHILSTNPGLYFAFSLRDVATSNITGVNYTKSRDIAQTTETLKQDDYFDETAMMLNETDQRRIYEYFCKVGRENEFVDIDNILPEKRNSPKFDCPEHNYVAPCGMLNKAHLFSRKNNKVPKPNLYLNRSPRFLDCRKKSRLRCHSRGPRRLANILNLNNAWS